MKKRIITRLLIGTAAAFAALALAFAPSLAAADPVVGTEQEQRSPADGTPQGAIEWFQAHMGDASYQGLCEKAVENAYGTTGVWASAIAHWNGAVNVGKAHPGDMNPPLGAFVYWDISQYGHVGISDGNGGFYATSVDGAIGHGGSLDYYGSYLGWSDAQVPAGKLTDGVEQH